MRTRTFIAVDLGKAVRDRMVKLQEQLGRDGMQLKWVEPDNLHVTLLFLGEVDHRELNDICKLASDHMAKQAPFEMSVESIGCFPTPRRPRIAWVGIGTGAQELCKIHDSLETPLQDLGYRREERKYTPHITLGRVKGDRSPDLTQALARHAGWKGGLVQVKEILIMGSELRSDGPEYTILGRAKLRGG